MILITVVCLVAGAAFLAIAIHEWRVYGRAAAIIPSILASAFVAAAFV